MSKFGDKLRAKKEKRLTTKTERRLKKGKHTMSAEDRSRAKQNRKKMRKNIKETTGRSGVSQAVDKVKGKVEKAKKTKVGKFVTKVSKKIKKGKETNLYKIAKGAKDTWGHLKSGKILKAIDTVGQIRLNKKKKK
tara:strand:+ start:313 stop:717 length:405 start_codon:yes stop_codon:yes gene_type:complete